MQQHCVGVYRGNRASSTPPRLDVQTPHPRWELLLLPGSKSDCSVLGCINYRGALSMVACRTISLSEDFPLSKISSWPNKRLKSVISFLQRLPSLLWLTLWTEAYILAPKPCHLFDREAGCVSVCVHGLFFPSWNSRKEEAGLRGLNRLVFSRSIFRLGPEALHFHILQLKLDWLQPLLLRDPESARCTPRMGGTGDRVGSWDFPE